MRNTQKLDMRYYYINKELDLSQKNIQRFHKKKQL